MKNKNPLYVVKGNDVEEVKDYFDLIVKKLGIEPLIELLDQISAFIISQVNSYPMLVAFKEFIDGIISRLMLFKQFSI